MKREDTDCLWRVQRKNRKKNSIGKYKSEKQRKQNSIWKSEIADDQKL